MLYAKSTEPMLKLPLQIHNVNAPPQHMLSCGGMCVRASSFSLPCGDPSRAWARLSCMHVCSLCTSVLCARLSCVLASPPCICSFSLCICVHACPVCLPPMFCTFACCVSVCVCVSALLIRLSPACMLTPDLLICLSLAYVYVCARPCSQYTALLRATPPRTCA